MPHQMLRDDDVKALRTRVRPRGDLYGVGLPKIARTYHVGMNVALDAILGKPPFDKVKGVEPYHDFMAVQNARQNIGVLPGLPRPSVAGIVAKQTREEGQRQLQEHLARQQTEKGEEAAQAAEETKTMATTIKAAGAVPQEIIDAHNKARTKAKRTGRTHVTPELIRRMLSDYAAGYERPDIAKRNGVAVNTVTRYLRGTGSRGEAVKSVIADMQAVPARPPLASTRAATPVATPVEVKANGHVPAAPPEGLTDRYSKWGRDKYDARFAHLWRIKHTTVKGEPWEHVASACGRTMTLEQAVQRFDVGAAMPRCSHCQRIFEGWSDRGQTPAHNQIEAANNAERMRAQAAEPVKAEPTPVAPPEPEPAPLPTTPTAAIQHVTSEAQKAQEGRSGADLSTGTPTGPAPVLEPVGSKAARGLNHIMADLKAGRALLREAMEQVNDAREAMQEGLTVYERSTRLLRETVEAQEGLQQELDEWYVRFFGGA